MMYPEVTWGMAASTTSTAAPMIMPTSLLRVDLTGSVVLLMGSHLSEQALGEEQQDQDQDDECEAVLIG